MPKPPMRSRWSGEKQVRSTQDLKRLVYVAEKASHAVGQCVMKADNRFETGGILIGYKLGRLYFVVAVTAPDRKESCSKVSFLLDGEEHTQKVNEIITSYGFVCRPSVLGVWHSHICDGHTFSRQDMLSNNALAKSFGGVLSMLVTKSAHAVLFSVSHISVTGAEEDCTIQFQAKAETGVKAYERERKMP